MSDRNARPRDRQRHHSSPLGSRSRSPHRDTSDRHHRSRTPDRDRKHHHHHRHHHHTSSRQKRKRTNSPKVTAPVVLPLNAKKLQKHDLNEYKAVFGMYLDIQKQLALEELPEDEVRGRWKRFVERWNRGELAEGWYDSSTKKRADEAAREYDTANEPREERRASPEYGGNKRSDRQNTPAEDDEDSENDVVGPTLPGHIATTSGGSGGRAGPTIPRADDLQLRKEMEFEDQLAARDDLRYARKLNRKAQKEALDELVPRAEAGTRERQLEKKREVNEKMRAFREKSPVEEVGEQDLMGDDGLDGFKKKKKEMERKKNERELRKEETLRVRAAEREERLQEHRQKEEKTMTMLKALAKQNYG